MTLQRKGCAKKISHCQKAKQISMDAKHSLRESVKLARWNDLYSELPSIEKSKPPGFRGPGPSGRPTALRGDRLRVG